jgi:chromosome segregation ATPase
MSRDTKSAVSPSQMQQLEELHSHLHRVTDSLRGNDYADYVDLSTELLSRPLSSKRLGLKKRAVERITQEKERWETLVRQCLGVADVCVSRGQPQVMGKDDLATVSKLLANAQTRLLGAIQFPSRKDTEEFRGKVWEVFTDLNHGVWKSCFHGKQADEASLLRRQLEEAQGKVDEMARDLKLTVAKPVERTGRVEAALSDTNRLRAELVFLTKANHSLQADLDCANSRVEALELKQRILPHSAGTTLHNKPLTHLGIESQELGRCLGELKQPSLDKRPNLRQVSMLSVHKSTESSILSPQLSSDEGEVSRLRDKLQKEKERSLNFYRALKRKEKECQDNHVTQTSFPIDGNTSKHRLEEENAKLQQQLRGSGEDAKKLADELKTLIRSYSSLQRDFERQASHLSKLEGLLPKQSTDLNDSFTQTSRVQRPEMFVVRSPGRLRKAKRQARDKSVEILTENHDSQDTGEATEGDAARDQSRRRRGVSKEHGELDELRKANSQLRANQSAIAISQGQLTQDLTDLQSHLKGKLDTAYSTIKLLEFEKQELIQQVNRLIRQLEVLQDEKTQRDTELKIVNAEKSFDRMEIEGLRSQLSPRSVTRLKVSYLEDKLEQVVQTLAAREDSLSSMANDNRLLREANDKLELQAKEKGLEGSHADCKLKLSSKEQEVRSLQGHTAELLREINLLHEELGKQKSGSSALEISIADLRKRSYEDLTRQVGELKQKVEILTSKSAVLETQSNKWKGEALRLEGELATATQGVSSRQRADAEAHKQLKAKQERIFTLVSENEILRSEVEHFKERSREAKAAEGKAMHEAERMNKIVADTTENLRRLEGDISCIDTQYRGLSEENETLYSQKATLEAAVKEVWTKMKNSEVKVTDLEKDRMAHQDQLRGLNLQLQSQQSMIEALEQTRSDLELRIRLMVEAEARQRGEMEQYVEELGLMKRQEEQLKGRCSALDAKLAKAADERKRLELAFSEGSGAVLDKAAEISQLTTLKAQLETSLAAALGERRRLEEALTTARQELKQRESQAEDNDKRLMSSQSTVSLLETQIKELQLLKTGLEEAYYELEEKLRVLSEEDTTQTKVSLAEAAALRQEVSLQETQIIELQLMKTGLEGANYDLAEKLRRLTEQATAQTDAMLAEAAALRQEVSLKETQITELQLLKTGLEGANYELEEKLRWLTEEDTTQTKASLAEAALRQEVSLKETQIIELQLLKTGLERANYDLAEKLRWLTEEDTTQTKALLAEVAALRQEVSHKETQIKELQLLKTGLEEANYELEEQLRVFTEEATVQSKAMLAEAAALKEEASLKETQIKELQLLKTGLEEAYYELEEQLRRLTEEDTTQTEATLAEAAALRQEVYVLTQAQTACESEVQLLSQSENSLKIQFARATEAQAEASRLLGEAESRLEKLKEEQSLALSQVADLTEKSAMYLAKIEALEEDVRAIEQEKAAGLQRETDMEHKLSALSQTEQDLGENLTKQRELSAKLSSENEQLRGSLSRAEQKSEDILKTAADRELLAEEAQAYSALVTEVSQLIGIKPPTADPTTHRGLVDDIGAFLKQEAILDRLVAALKVTRIEEVEEAVRLSLGAAAKVKAAEADSQALSRAEKENGELRRRQEQLCKEIEGLTKANGDTFEANESQIADLKLKLQEKEADLQDQVDRTAKSSEEASERQQALNKQLVQAQSKLEESAKELSTLKQQHAVCSLTQAELQREIDALARAQRTAFSFTTTEPNSPREGTEMQRQLVMTVASLRRAETRCKELERQNEDFRELMTSPQRDELDDEGEEKQLAAFKREAAEKEKRLVFEIQQLKESLADFNAEIQGLNEENERLVLQLAQSSPAADDTSSLVQAKAAITKLQSLLSEARGEPEGEVEVCRRIGYNGTDWLLLRSEEDLYYWMRFEEAGMYVQDMGRWEENMPEE